MHGEGCEAGKGRGEKKALETREKERQAQVKRRGKK